MFYDRFAEMCRERGIKPGRACVEMGASRSLAAKWKREKTEVPSMDVVSKISDYFGLSIDEILGKTQKEKSTPVSEGGLIAEISDLASQLTPEHQRLILAQIKGILSNRE